MKQPVAAGPAGEPAAAASAVEGPVPIAQAVVAAAPSRVLWGTDWPHPNMSVMPDEGSLLDLLGDIVPDEEIRNQILTTNPETLYDFR